MSTNTLKTLAAVAALSFTLAACGGGGGGSSNNTSSNGGGGGTSTPSTPAASNGTALLAAYTPPDSIVADVQTNYAGPAFSTYNSGLSIACSNPSVVSKTVVETPNVRVFSAGASLKAQELAADLFEQAVPQIRTALGLPATGTAFDGTNKVSLCVDPSLGQSGAETGGSITAQTGTGIGPVMQIMSADSPNFDARYPNAPGYGAYAGLFVHEGTHAALYSQVEPFEGLDLWFQEGMATTVSQAPIGSKASVLASVQAADLLNSANNVDLNAYPAYESTVGYLTSRAPGGLGFGLTNVPAFLATFKQNALAACARPIPASTIVPPQLTVGLPAGLYNTCSSLPGTTDPKLLAAFDAAFNATFKDSNGAPLLLHTADDPTGNSLEQTLYARLNGFLP